MLLDIYDQLLSTADFSVDSFAGNDSKGNHECACVRDVRIEPAEAVIL